MGKHTAADVVAAAAEVRGQLEAVLERIPPGRWRERVGRGRWSATDIVAHLAYWNGRLPSDLQACLDETAEHESGYAVNQRVARELAHWEPGDARRAFAESWDALVAAIVGLPEGHPRFGAALKLAHHEAVEHVAGHAEQLRAWWSSVGSADGGPGA